MGALAAGLAGRWEARAGAVVEVAAVMPELTLGFITRRTFGRGLATGRRQRRPGVLRASASRQAADTSRDRRSEPNRNCGFVTGPRGRAAVRRAAAPRCFTLASRKR